MLNKFALKIDVKCAVHSLLRNISSTQTKNVKHKCKLLIVGGGSGGCPVAAKFSRCLKKQELIVLDPSEYHYYQPLFTLIGAGIGTIEESRRKQRDVLPKNCTWMKSSAVEFNPKQNTVLVANGDEIEYEFMVVAVGLHVRYDKIPGVLEGLRKPSLVSGVCSNYSPEYVNRTFEVLKRLDKGNALFTYPRGLVKCAGAPQKACYLADNYLRNVGRRSQVTLIYTTTMPELFLVKKYAKVLSKVCRDRNIHVKLRTHLDSIDPDKNEATFVNLDKPDVKTTIKYTMLHVTPPMCPPEALTKNKDLTNKHGYAEVDKRTLQHIRFPNVYSLGDCSSLPTGKTSAAAASQSRVLHKNLCAAMKGEPPRTFYDGYTACPLVTGYNKCVLAEFDYDLNPLETFPFSQDKELYSMYVLKKDLMPPLYWHIMLNGYWNGPAMFRKIMHCEFLGTCKKNDTI